MIRLASTEQCTGCKACQAICPNGAIQMQVSSEGFSYPKIVNSKCIECHSCERICPVLKKPEKEGKLQSIFAAKLTDTIQREKSSSGGVFSALAEFVLENSGTVYGCAFNEKLEAEQVKVETHKKLDSLYGSKYVQSDMKKVYGSIKEDLSYGRMALFVGTPCQVDAVKSFIEEKSLPTDNFYCAALICHGVPSPMVWQDYLDVLKEENGERPGFAKFRGKEDGWHARIAIRYFNKDKNPVKDPRFTEMFLSNRILRKGCYNCRYTTPYRTADLTLGDFWGIENTEYKQLDDDMGTSLILCHSDKGQWLLDQVKDKLVLQSVEGEDAMANQHTLQEPFQEPADRELFWNDYFSHGFIGTTHKYFSTTPPDAYIEPVRLENKKRVVILPDGAGSKGDEALLRGVLNVFANTQSVTLLTPRKELWRNVVIDRSLEFNEYYVPIKDIAAVSSHPVKLIIVGTDVIDGTCGVQDSLTRLKAANATAKCGGSVSVFCSFRSDVSLEILEEIAKLPNQVKFYLRDKISLQNFKKLTGRAAEYFPDFAFFCESKKTLLTEEYATHIKRLQNSGKTVIGLNFGEPSFRSFYAEHTVEARASYVEAVLKAVMEEIPQAYVVLISHDSRHWDGYFSDADYQKLAMVVARNLGFSKQMCMLPARATHAELLEVLPYLDFVITGRMHLSVAAMHSGIVPVVYTGASKDGKFSMIEKVRGMLESRIGRSDLAASSMAKFRTALREVYVHNKEIKTGLIERNKENDLNDFELVKKFTNKKGPTAASENQQNEIMMRAAESIYELQEKQIVKEHIDKRLFEEEKNNLNGHISQLLESERKLNQKNEEALSRLQRQEEMLNEKVAEIYEKEQDIIVLKTELNSKSMQLMALSARSNQLDTVYASRTWRYAHKLAKMARFFCPLGSLRARVIGSLVRVPLRFEHWLRALPAQLREKKERKHFFERLKPVSLPECETPVVSIIIPVYNQFMYTYNCLSTIATQCRGMEYEVIIADDNSKDETVQIKEKAPGVIVVRNTENLRFLRNCNNAAKSARGKYIVFLNNDTEVQPDWLQSLLTTIEVDEKIGMVGSKLVYSNGQLQEAGGILWRDGSAWNYGHGDDPEKSEYNYVKDVDYISGCSILIRRRLWQEIGGFDERFAPAYCEDSDLAFEVRAHGYRVVYQPASAVIHHEGISNGTDTNNGQKQYQVINANKFREKWKEVLQKEQFPSAQNVFCARDRSGKKPCILFIDHYTPTFDQDAGSRTVYEYLRLFVKMGYNVKFIPDNFYRMPKYCEALQQLGIEVLYGPDYAQHWQDWVIEHRDALQFVFTNRPHISIKYMDFLRNNTNAKIMYYGHDLHSLRERREYELSGDPKLLESSQKWKSIEYSLMRKSDIAYYPSEIEQQVILENDPTINVKVLVPYIFYDVQNPDYHISDRRDVMFLGGFNHGPNVDAALWFAKEIFPLVQKELPHLHWHILGSHPPKEVEELTCGKITVHGFVTDEQLADFYASCRMSIVPLRYGAGIKGKVIEAMKFGIPVLTTSVGAEGIGGSEDALAVEDEPQAFADRLISLYTDEEALRKMSKAAYQYILNNYAPEKAMKLIEEDFT